MGTLTEQPVCRRHEMTSTTFDEWIDTIKKLAFKHDMSCADVIAAYGALELKRQNDIAVSNGDIHDEQMRGLGVILEQIVDNLESISASAHDAAELYTIDV